MSCRCSCVCCARRWRRRRRPRNHVCVGRAGISSLANALGVFITAVPITKLLASGEGDSGGHVLRETTSRGLCGLVCPSRTGTREEPGTLTLGGVLFSLVPLVWESNPKLQGGWRKPNHQPIGGSDPNHQGIWSPPRAGQLNDEHRSAWRRSCDRLR